MIAYKGFTKDLWSRMGDGKENTCSFVIGETKTVPESKTARSGFHCCENPFECLRYYPLGENNRYFLVEAAGDINEDEMERIACTKITLKKELTLKEFAGHGMTYIIRHPNRRKWQQFGVNLMVAEDEAEGTGEGMIAIARGKRPLVRGKAGSICGLILEPWEGQIAAAKLFVAGEDGRADTWYTLNAERELVEI